MRRREASFSLDLTVVPLDPLQGFDKDGLAEALRGCDLVIIPAGVPRKPGMTRDDLFKVCRRAQGIED